VSGIAKCRPPVLAVLLLSVLAACGGTNTTNTVQVVPACSQSYPNGSCDAGSTCFNGACVVASTLCSPTNLTGTCSAGTTCLSGGCVVSTDLCSPTNTSGICPAGQGCFAGTCATSASECSAANPSGTCPSGSTCFSGGCVQSSVLCSATNTDGVCADNSVCFGGACVLASSLCSATNTSGSCPSGSTCFGGGCVESSVLCGSAAPTGICPVGEACFQNGCVAVSSLCSTSNTAGSCPTGQTCQAGQCASPQVDPCTVAVYTAQPEIAVAHNASSTPAGILTVDGLQFKDLSKDGKLDPYEDWRLSELCRAKDLVSKMTLPQKIGLMTEVSNIGSGTADGSIPANVASFVVTGFGRQALDRISSAFTPAQTARYMNNIQELSESQPLGIPFVVTADPSSGFSMNISPTTGVMAMGGASSTGGTGNSSLVGLISQWPQPLGIGAINDPAIAAQAGDNIRREYRGLGLRWELGPQADIATEPRWARVNNTFGENPIAVANMVVPFLQGMQGVNDGGLKGGGIASTIKHFPGAGADQGGMDSHTYPGRYNVYPGNNFNAHVYAFRAAVAAGAAAVMPCYSIFKNQWTVDPLQLGSVYSHESVTDLLKTQLGFNGLVSSDWGVISSKNYGLENASNAEKGAMFIKSGAHQIGQDSAATSILLAYQAGLLADADIDNAAAKILEMSFKLGLFENPYTDYTTVAGHTTAWTSYVNSATARTNAFNAQKMAMVVLRNRDHTTGNAYLPIDGSRKVGSTAQAVDDTNNDGTINVYFDGINDSIVGVSNGTSTIDSLTDIFGDYDYTSAGNASSTPVAATSDITKADLAIIRIVARKGAYSGLDAGVPLSFDAPFPGTQNDSEAAPARASRNKILDALRARDGYNKWDATNSVFVPVAATNPTLKIIMVMHMDRPGIVKPFINGLLSLDDAQVAVGTGTDGKPDFHPLVSNEANINQVAAGANVTKGVDAFLVEFGAFDRAVLDVVFNQHKPSYLAPGQTAFHYGTARLPMEIPSTDAEVAAQLEDVPADTANPSYKLGAGTTFTQ
jgi:beta-glucosidase